MVAAFGEHWYEAVQTGKLLVLRFAGHSILEETTVRILEDDICQRIEQCRCEHLLLNFHEVNNLNSYFLSSLIRLGRMMDKRQGRMVICSLDPRLQQVFHELCLDRRLSIYRNEEEALKALSATIAPSPQPTIPQDKIRPDIPSAAK